MRLRLIFTSLIGSAGLVAACGSDTSTNVSHDAGMDASLDAQADTYVAYDTAPGADVADSSPVPKPCDPSNDTCGVSKMCCQVKGTSADGGPNYVCVLVKPPDNICPPVN